MSKRKQIKVTIKRNIWGNLYAYFGKRRIKMFGDSDFDARIWAESVSSKGHKVTAHLQS